MSETNCHNLANRARYERGGFFVARLTPIGRGGVSCVGVSGETCAEPLFRRVRHDRFHGSDLLTEFDRPYFAFFSLSEREDVFEEVVLRRRGASVYEIDCHGGDLVTSRIIEFFVKSGAKTLSADEWERMVERQEALDAMDANTNRAPVGRNLETTFEELAPLEELFFSKFSELIERASSEETARIACDQRHSWRRFWEKLVSDLSVFSRIDSESDPERIVQVLNELLLRRAWGHRLFEPFVVIILGAPNVGKSRLFNALLGYDRSVVSPEEGTTRDLVGATILLKGWSFRIVDAAGLRATDDRVEQDGVEYARQFSGNADLVLCCYDANRPKEEQESFWNRIWKDGFFSNDVKTLKVLNKSDLLVSDSEKAWTCSDFVRVSALRRQGLERLVERIYQHTVGELIGFSEEWDDLPIMWTKDQETFLRSVRDLCVERRYQDALARLGARSVGGF